MELTEAVQRILRHLRLIVAVLGVALLIPILLNMGHQDTYVASTRLSIGRDTTNSEEAKALVDTAQGIVSSPSEVATALKTLSIDRDETKIAKKDVDVQSVGISGVLILSVTDADPGVAAALSNALAEQFLAARRKQSLEPLQERLTQFDEELTAVGKEIDAIEAAALQPGSPIDTLRLRLDEAARRRSDIRTLRQEVIGTLAALPKPTLIDPATQPSAPEPVRLPANMAVAGILGLIMGLALASVLEALRPTIVSGDSLARVLGTPILGRVPNPPQLNAKVGDQWVPEHLQLAASSAGVDIVGLVGVGRSVDLWHLATQLQNAATPQLVVDVVEYDSQDLRAKSPSTSTRPPGSSRPSWAALGHALSADRSRLGLVVVAPEVLRRGALSELEHLLVITEWPLLGVITYPKRRTRRRKLGQTDFEIEVGRFRTPDRVAQHGSVTPF